jgi:hypothetical protein
MRRLSGTLGPIVVVVLGLALPAGSAASPSPARFQVGTGVVDVTPDPQHPQYLGGYDRMDSPTGDAHDPLQVRTFFIARGSHAVAFTIVDSQGWFAGYQEGPYGITDARSQAATWLQGRGYDVGPGNLIVSSTHSHSAPTIMGIWGPTDPAYLKRIHDATVESIKEAAANTHTAELWSASGSIKTLVAHNVEGTDHFDGWDIDAKTPVLWARAPRTGATLGLYTNVPVHADQFRGSKYRQASADYPGFVRDSLERSLGGTAVVAEGTLGRQEAMGGEDDYAEVERQGTFISNAITRALARARPITDGHIDAAQQYITVPAHNPALLALLYGNLTGFQCFDDPVDACTIDRSVKPPYLAGDVIGTWVTTLRVGDQVYTSEPGEAFPEVSTAIRKSIRGAAGAHVVGMAQDQLGYYYPPEDYPASEINPSDFILFNVSPTLADESVDAAALNANRVGFTGVPHHPTSDDEKPHAFFEPGTQFWPTVIESASESVDFLGGGKASEAPTLNGDGHTVSDITWDFGDGTAATSKQDERITHTFPGPGSYPVTTTVHDEQGQVRTYTETVIVDPDPRAGIAMKRVGPHRRLFRARVVGGDGHVIAAHWTFSDGTTADGLRVVHPDAGGLSVTVSVVDGAGDRAEKTLAL